MTPTAPTPTIRLFVLDTVTARLAFHLGMQAATLPGDPEQHVEDLLVTFRNAIYEGLMAATEEEAST